MLDAEIKFVAPVCFIARAAAVTALFETEREAAEALEISGGSIFVSRADDIERLRTIPPRMSETTRQPVFIAEIAGRGERHFDQRESAREWLRDNGGGVIYVSKTAGTKELLERIPERDWVLAVAARGGTYRCKTVEEARTLLQSANDGGKIVMSSNPNTTLERVQQRFILSGVR